MSSRKYEYRLRTYEEGDETELTSLFNEVYRDYAGFVPRTLEYWRWSCLDRPDVEKEGILIGLHEERIVAYAVVGKSGNIWELCVSRSYEEHAIVSLILSNAVQYLSEVGAESVTLNVSSEDSGVRGTCEKLGFVQVPSEKMFLSSLDFQQLFSLLFRDRKERLKNLDGKFLVSLRDAPFWISPYISVKINNGQAMINAYKRIEECNDPLAVHIKTDTVTLTSILFGTSDPLWAMLLLKLRIYPSRKFRNALRLLSILRLNDPWFFPSSDYG